MKDPLSEVVSLLQPRAAFTRPISGAGQWAVRYSRFGMPSFCAVLEGTCLLSVDGYDTITLRGGDFILLPGTPGFTMSGLQPVQPEQLDPKVSGALPVRELRHGRQDGPADVRQLGGSFEFDSPDPTLLVSLLPGLVHIRDAERLGLFVRLIDEELQQQKPGHDFAVGRLVELLLIEALRETSGEHAPPGLLRGLSDPRLSRALREMHRDLTQTWTMDSLAKVAALSRSTFFERFKRTVGVPPMEYLLAWRMAVARNLLRRDNLRSRKWPSAWDMARPAPSAPRSAGTWESRQVNMPGKRPWSKGPASGQAADPRRRAANAQSLRAKGAVRLLKR